MCTKTDADAQALAKNYDRNIDALQALILFAALLPEHRWLAEGGVPGKTFTFAVFHPDEPDTPFSSGEHPVPHIALLIAILKAHKAIYA